jgi:hypothetical protein
MNRKLDVLARMEARRLHQQIVGLEETLLPDNPHCGGIETEEVNRIDPVGDNVQTNIVAIKI